ncbi:hypothetical protein PRK78_002102 [Emydomyces testavorans]|uniref:Copper-fist domain-containing protein n=1 Tax=Emydomyces testavorans TaxID=2070801 RepID=A0AAF0IJB7_9EURO|nr:hypothetical protein PRK78_002102 [Emydomyces testavorans]
MPLDEEGAKWSCEPCIRGHRSSKCQHFDRLMMKVPKAGRPLAKCPHPKGTCSCQKIYAFMVRIPKGSTCLCRPLYQVPMPGSEPGQSSGKVSPKSSPPLSGAQSSIGPLPAGGPPNRVQKRSKRQNSIQSSSETVAKGLAALSEASEETRKEAAKPTPRHADVHTPTSTSSCHMPIVPIEAYRHNPIPVRTDYVHRPLSIPSTNSYSTSTTTFQQNDGGFPQGPAPSIPQCPAPCCSKAENSDSDGTGAKNTARQLRNPALGYPSTQESYTFGSFGQEPLMLPKHAGPRKETPSSLISRTSNMSAVSMTAFSNPFSLPNVSYSGPHVSPNDAGRSSLTQNVSSNSSNPFPQNYFGLESQPGHNCGCGDGCQCLGCASHPFNETTRHYIQEMGYMMTFGNDDEGDNQPKSPYGTHDFSKTFESNSYQPSTFGQNNSHEHFSGDLTNQPVTSLVNDAALPSPVLYGQNYERLMEPTAYYTLEYSVGMPDLALCTNIMGTCQCGISCKCIGCLTHDGHNGVSLEPSPPPERSTDSLTPATDKCASQTQPTR